MNDPWWMYLIVGFLFYPAAALLHYTVEYIYQVGCRSIRSSSVRVPYMFVTLVLAIVASSPFALCHYLNKCVSHIADKMADSLIKMRKKSDAICQAKVAAESKPKDDVHEYLALHDIDDDLEKV